MCATQTGLVYVLTLLPVRKNALYHTHIHVYWGTQILFACRNATFETVDKSIVTQISRVDRLAFQNNRQTTGKRRSCEQDTKITRVERRSKLTIRALALKFRGKARSSSVSSRTEERRSADFVSCFENGEDSAKLANRAM